MSLFTSEKLNDFFSLGGPNQQDPAFDKHKVFSDSTALDRAWYSSSENSLVVQTHGGHLYQYINVPVGQWNDLVNSSSPGREWAKIRSHYGSDPNVKGPEQSTFKITARVFGTIELTSDAPAISEAFQEALSVLSDKFSGTGADFAIDKVERI